MVLRTNGRGKHMPRLTLLWHIVGLTEMVTFKFYDKFALRREGFIHNSCVWKVSKLTPSSAFCLKKGRTVGSGGREYVQQRRGSQETRTLTNKDVEHMCFFSLSSRPHCFRWQSRCHICEQFCPLLRLSLFPVDLEQRKINEMNSFGRQSEGSWERTELHRHLRDYSGGCEVYSTWNSKKKKKMIS